MNTTKISYGRTIPLGSFNSERLEVEVEISEGEHPEDAFAYAKELIDRIHRDNNPHLYPTQQNNTAVTNHTPTPTPEEPIKRTIPLSKEEKERKNIENMIAKIEQYMDADQLESDYKMWLTNPAIKAAIDLRKIQLKQKV